MATQSYWYHDDGPGRSAAKQAAWEAAHPKETRLLSRIETLGFGLSRASAHLDWVDYCCAKYGLGVNERYHEVERDIARKYRLKGALELKLKELLG